MRHRQGLITRVIQMRHGAQVSDSQVAPPAQERATVESLHVRVAHLEDQLEGLQDAIHRESTRLSARIAELEVRLEPSALAVALSRDARERGL